MPDLLVLVPTRGRPDNAARLAAAFRRTCTADTRLALLVDSDDERAAEYYALASDGPRNVCVVPAGPWRPMVPKLNAAAMLAATASGTLAGLEGDWTALAFMGDDHRPRTARWDTKMLAELHDLGTGVVYGDDLLQGERLCTAWAMTSDMIRALGRMVPAPVEHMFCDNAVMDLATAAKCLRYLPEVVIEHCHPMAGKADWDPGYWRVNRPEQYQRDGDIYQTYLAVQFADDVAAVSELREVASCR